MLSNSAKSINSGYMIRDYKNNNNNKNALIGSSISAVVVKKDEKYATLKTDDDFSFKIDSSKIVGEEGDRLFFEVIKNDKKELLLKQVRQDSNEQAYMACTQTNIKGVKAMFEQQGFIKDESLKESIEKDLEIKRALSSIRDKLMYNPGEVSTAAVKELISAGLSLDKIDFQSLTGVMRDIRLSVNQKEIKDIKKKLDQIGSLNEKSAALLLKQQKGITADSMYMAKFSEADSLVGKKIDEKTLQELEPQLQRLFEAEGIENSQKNMEAAKFLLKYDIDITKDNISKALFLRSFSDIAKDGAFLEKVANYLQDGASLGQTPIYDLYYSSGAELEAGYKEVIEALPAIEQEPVRIDYLIKNNIALTLYNLKNTKIAKDEKPPELNGELKEISVLSKLQLREIQLKLTYQAAHRLAGKGIDINTMPLETALEQLRQDEYAQSLKLAGAEETPQVMNEMGRTFNALSRINPLTNNVFANIIKGENKFSLFEIQKDVAYAKAHEGYEQFATVPRVKYGDSFNMLKDSFAGLLENLEIEVTKANIKAAAILSKNSIDVTKESIEQVKVIDAKIDYVLNRLHPVIAADIIKKGNNPADMHIDELITKIDEFNDTYGENLKDTIAKHVLEFDSSGFLNSQERDAMIAIYRMLNAASKNNGAPLGVLIKNDVELTLGNMLEASKYMSKPKIDGESVMDININDDFGLLQRLEAGDNNIYKILSFKNFANNAHPKALAEYLGKNPDYKMQSIESADEKLSEIAEDMDLTHQKVVNKKAEEITSLYENKSNTINALAQNNIPATAANINAFNKLMKNPYFIADSLDETEISFEESELNIDNISGTSSDYELEQIYNRLESIKDNETDGDIIKNLSAVQNAIKLQQVINKSAGVKLPADFKGKIAGLNVYIINENTSNGELNVLFSLKTKNLGKVTMEAGFKNGAAEIFVNSDNPEGINRLESNRDVIIKGLENAGIRVDSIKFPETTTSTGAEQSQPVPEGLTAEPGKYEMVV